MSSNSLEFEQKMMPGSWRELARVEPMDGLSIAEARMRRLKLVKSDAAPKGLGRWRLAQRRHLWSDVPGQRRCKHDGNERLTTSPGETGMKERRNVESGCGGTITL